MKRFTNNSDSKLSLSFINIIKKLSCVLNNIIKCNNNYVDLTNEYNLKIKTFYLKDLPDISLYNYISKISWFSKISESTLIYSFIILDKLINKTKINLTSKNIYLLCLTSIQISMKINEDISLNDTDLAYIGMINIKLLNINEYLFTSLLEYEFYVSQNEYALYYRYLD